MWRYYLDHIRRIYSSTSHGTSRRRRRQPLLAASLIVLTLTGLFLVSGKQDHFTTTRYFPTPRFIGAIITSRARNIVNGKQDSPTIIRHSLDPLRYGETIIAREQATTPTLGGLNHLMTIRYLRSRQYSGAITTRHMLNSEPGTRARSTTSHRRSRFSLRRLTPLLAIVTSHALSSGNGIAEQSPTTPYYQQAQSCTAIITALGQTIGHGCGAVYRQTTTRYFPPQPSCGATDSAHIANRLTVYIRNGRPERSMIHPAICQYRRQPPDSRATFINLNLIGAEDGSHGTQWRQI
jgi:hypothetical protein